MRRYRPRVYLITCICRCCNRQFLTLCHLLIRRNFRRYRYFPVTACTTRDLILFLPAAIPLHLFTASSSSSQQAAALLHLNLRAFRSFPSFSYENLLYMCNYRVYNNKKQEHCFKNSVVTMRQNGKQLFLRRHVLHKTQFDFLPPLC